jgi:hypothetical protein
MFRVQHEMQGRWGSGLIIGISNVLCYDGYGCRNLNCQRFYFYIYIYLPHLPLPDLVNVGIKFCIFKQSFWTRLQSLFYREMKTILRINKTYILPI